MATPLGFHTLLYVLLLGALVISAPEALANSKPEDYRSDLFSVFVDGREVSVYRAAAGYSYANIQTEDTAEISVRAHQAGFWQRGCEIAPWRLGIRPQVQGDRITFRGHANTKLVISRPNEFGFDAVMLFLFVAKPTAATPAARPTRFIPPGVHHGDLDLRSGDRIHIADGAVVVGAINIWDAQDVEITGQGLVVYDGPQNPNEDEGWMHRRSWHGITLHDSKNIRISGITVAVRSRTWMIQIQGCKHVTFDDVKVIGGFRANANQDGIDWLGCGDTVVRNCFFRASDDIFAIYGNTGFYDSTVAIPGRDVANILIEGCTLSTSISNVLRVGWARKIFNSSNVILRDCDVVHMGMGGCVVPFALAEFWSDPDGQGIHEHYRFEDIRLDHWHALAQLREPQTNLCVRDVAFRGIWSMGLPPREVSAISGNVTGVSLAGSDADRVLFHPLDTFRAAVSSGQGGIADGDYPSGRFTYAVRAESGGKEFDFRVLEDKSSDGCNYAWSFGDGSTGLGASTVHYYSDQLGSDLSGSGVFRVILTVTSRTGRKAYETVWLVLGGEGYPSVKPSSFARGFTHEFFAHPKADLSSIDDAKPFSITVAPAIRRSELFPPECRRARISGYFDAPTSGGYLFTFWGRSRFVVKIDGREVARNDAQIPQPCGTSGYVIQQLQGHANLEAGAHFLEIEAEAAGTADFAEVFWEGPGLRFSPLLSAQGR